MFYDATWSTTVLGQRHKGQDQEKKNMFHSGQLHNFKQSPPLPFFIATTIEAPSKFPKPHKIFHLVMISFDYAEIFSTEICIALSVIKTTSTPCTINKSHLYMRSGEAQPHLYSQITWTRAPKCDWRCSSVVSRSHSVTYRGSTSPKPECAFKTPPGMVGLKPMCTGMRFQLHLEAS